MQTTNQFFIKPEYSPRQETHYFEDVAADETGIVHQPDVYTLAAFLGRKFDCSHILDIGCGRGRKLSSLHPDFKLVGIDFGSNIAYCKKEYSFGEWLEKDLEKPHYDLLPPHTLDKTLIVCSDVVEHLSDPGGLLETLSYCLEHAPVAILTTPERDLVRGPDDNGPPANPAHIREWNRPELAQLLKAYGFKSAFLGLTCNNSRDLEKKTTLAILHGRPVPVPSVCTDSSFRVVAFMTAYNEADLIFHSVSRLLNAGIDVYLIDNWSTDNTAGLLEPLLGKGLIGIERFPPEGSTGTYDWHRLLSRVEQLAATMSADWFIHHDVDEIRESPWPEINLRDVIWYADKLGFNAIDHTVIDFRPIDNSFVAGTDFGAHFEYWEFGRRVGHFQQIKAWKNLAHEITLAQTGGHDVNFPGRRVFPYKLLLRHYPVRSQQHGDRKILAERKPRFNPFERNQRGWHTQYNEIQQGHNFLRLPETLNQFNAERFCQDYLVERISGIGILRKDESKPVTRLSARLLTRLKTLFRPT
ncbi:MAG: methyltransferase domain-containing protein [Rhodocyclaceae bacterium]